MLGAIVSVQAGNAVATTLFAEVGPAGTVLFRLSFAAAILLAIWRPRLSRYSRQQLVLAAAFGLSLAAMNLLFYAALDRIPLGVAVTLEFIGPLAVAIAGSRRAFDLIWVAMAAAGIFLLIGPVGSSPDALGMLFALGAGACWGSYILFSARLGRLYEDGTGLALAMAVAALLTLGPGIAAGGSDLLSAEVVAVGLVVAVLSALIPFTLEFEALRRIPTHVFGVLMSVEPAVAAVIGLVALDQGLAAAEAAGIGLVVGASAGALRAPGAVPPRDS